jgi:hypothetical protein
MAPVTTLGRSSENSHSTVFFLLRPGGRSLQYGRVNAFPRKRRVPVRKELLHDSVER